MELKRRIIGCFVLTAGLVFVLTGRGVRAQATAASAGTVHVLMRQPLRSQPGNDVVLLTVDYPPGGTTPPHEHPGYVYAYVLAGSVVSKLDDQPVQTYTEGQAWSELPDEHHVVSKNGSATLPARLLVFFIIPHNQPLTKFLPAK